MTSMLNPPEREKYNLGRVVGNIASKVFKNKSPSSKAVKGEMEKVHSAVNEARLDFKVNEAHKKVAEDLNLPLSTVKGIESDYAYRAGGGGGDENLLEEIRQTLRAMKVKETPGQTESADLGGSKVTKEARKAKGKAVVKAVGATLLTNVPTAALVYNLALSDEQESKVKENKPVTVTDITSGTVDQAYSKATANPTKYIFLKDGRSYIKYKGKDTPLKLATSEEDTVLDLIPRKNKAEGSTMKRQEYKEGNSVFNFEDLEDVKPAKMPDITKGRSKSKKQDIVDIPGIGRVDISKAKPVKMPDVSDRKSKTNSNIINIPGIGDIDLSKVKPVEMRKIRAEGSLMTPEEGMPVDTYPNIPPEDMAEVEASQLPDDEMEEGYIDFVMDESLDDSEQEYLARVIENDPRLSDILDKVITTASEFSGAGEVDGPGTGVSDSIPARLSDGEFVFTKKATDQLGADNLQVMMDDAERAYDGGLQQFAFGGMADKEDELEDSRDYLSKTDEEIKKVMIGSNRMPSVR